MVSRNANVANGQLGDEDNRALTEAVAGRLGCDVTDVLVSSTGVIGRRYPIDRMLEGIAAMPERLPEQSIDRAAAAMMTTDTRPKIAERAVAGSAARVVGVAKGAGMIEPNMATMIAVILTDAEVAGDELAACFSAVVDETFNCVSIDTDTSTSDTAVVLASGEAGPVDGAAFTAALHDVALSLAKQIAGDGEGAETLIEVRVDGARDRAQAKRVAKSIVNSPLVKTAVHGADPNWGRVAMAIGKCEGDEDADIDPDAVVIRFGDQEVYPQRLDDERLAELSAYLRGPEVLIHVIARHRRRGRHRVGLRPHRRLRPHQRRLHDLTDPSVSGHRSATSRLPSTRRLDERSLRRGHVAVEPHVRRTHRRVVIDSELLRGNPLGDPHERPLWVYVPPGYDDRRRYPSVYVLQGYTGMLPMWRNRSPFRQPFPEVADSRSPPVRSVRASSSTSTPGPRSAARSSSTPPAPAATTATSATRSSRSSMPATARWLHRSTAACPASRAAGSGR